MIFTSNPIYKYFNKNGDSAKCVFCKKSLLCKIGSTKGLWTHLKAFHNPAYVKLKRRLQKQLKEVPKKITQTVVGQKRVYNFLRTLDSWEELDKFRFEHHCRFIGHYKRRRNVSRSIIIPCSWRITGRKCEYVLKALRPDLESGKIHVYSFSKHNHPLECDEKRVIHITPKELMADANPPPTLRTLDHLEWTFLQTIPDYDKMHKFRHENQCQSRSYDSMWQRVRYSCYRRRSTDLCKFKLMAMKTPNSAYHMYKHGEHNHAASIPKNITKTKALRQTAAVSEDPPAAVQDLPAIAEDLPVPAAAEDPPSAANPPAAAEDPPASIRTSDNIEWKFLQTFPDYEAMDEFRCENLCSSKPLDTTETGKIRYSCNRRFSTNRCQFQLLAVETTNKKGYHVYQHGEHKHPVIKRETEKGQQSTNDGQGQQQNIEKKQIKIENDDKDEGDDDDDDEDEDEDNDDEVDGDEDDGIEDEDDNGHEDDEEEEDDDSDDSVDDPDYRVAAKRILPRKKGITTRRSGRGLRRTNGAGQ